MFLRLYLLQVIREHERLLKVAVPCPLVDDFFLVFPWPPKGEKTVGQCIASWATPEKYWTTYEQGKRRIKRLNLGQKKILQMKIVSF